jgi:hypothetical protein
MFYIGVALSINGYFVYGKPAKARRQLEVIKKPKIGRSIKRKKHMEERGGAWHGWKC